MNSVVLRVMRFWVWVGVIVGTISVAMCAGINDDLSSAVARAAVLCTDHTVAGTLRAIIT